MRTKDEKRAVERFVWSQGAKETEGRCIVELFVTTPFLIRLPTH